MTGVERGEPQARRVTLDDLGMTPFLRRVTLFSSGGPFLDGYVLAIIGVALTQLTPELGLTTAWTGAIGASALVGIFVGTSVGGYVTDLIGRKRMFIIDVVAIGLVSIATTFAHTPLTLVVMRLLIGVVIGADYPIATSLVAEFTPTRYRAISMGFIAAMWYVGANVAYVVGYALVDVAGGWRWMLGSVVIPCLVILVGRWGVPESPRWLIRRGRADEARAIVRDLFGQQVVIEAEEAVRTRYSQLFQREYLGKMIFVGTIWLCQAVPMFAIYTFGPDIMSAFHLDNGRNAILGEVVIGTFFMVGCVPAMFWANSLGRRKLVIGGFALMTAALAVLGAAPAAPVAVVVICFATYAFFSGGPGNLQWLYPNELFPTEIRASAVGAAMAFSRIGTVISTFVLPGFLATYGTRATMLAGTAISALGLAVSIAMAPETRGLTLIETSRLGLGGTRVRPPTGETADAMTKEREPSR